MKDVKFEHITAKLSGYGFGKGIESRFNGAEDIIKKEIENGWDFCGYIPLETRGTGEIQTISLIFQKEE